MAVQVPTGSLSVGLENSSTNSRKLTFCQFINPTLSTQCAVWGASGTTDFRGVEWS